MQQEQTFKILLIGDSGTGKSSLLLRFTDDTFLEDEMSATIGVDFKVHHLPLSQPHSDIMQSDRMKLSIWDTAGQERFRTLTSSYYRGAQGVILVYDVSDKITFDHLLDTWLPELEIYAPSKSVVKMIVGNKVDKDSDRQVSTQAGQEFAKSHGALFIECSAKTKAGVEQAFEELCLRIIETPDLWKKKEAGEIGKVDLNSSSTNGSGGGFDGGACSC